jgi:hypothetical protein
MPAIVTASSLLVSLGSPLQASNLPVSNGASGLKTGSAEALKPIVDFKWTLEKAAKEKAAGTATVFEREDNTGEGWGRGSKIEETKKMVAD